MGFNQIDRIYGSANSSVTPGPLSTMLRPKFRDASFYANPMAHAAIEVSIARSYVVFIMTPHKFLQDKKKRVFQAAHDRWIPEHVTHSRSSRPPHNGTTPTRKVFHRFASHTSRAEPLVLRKATESEGRGLSSSPVRPANVMSPAPPAL